jgi:AraC-like DNA-binding protein
MPECLMFHVVTSGGCWVEFEDGEKCYLGCGDFALIPHGRGHVLKSEPEAKTINIFDLPRELISPRYELLNHGGGGTETHVICGAVRVEDPAAQRVINMLPEIIVTQANTPENEWLLGTIRIMMTEAQAMRPGGDTVITRVSDILVVQAIRSWLDNDPLAKTGWLGALQDGQIGQAIALIHRYPTHPWSVETIAERIGMSRSAFAARFMTLVGEPPMHYVRQWRFNVAISWLKESDLPIAEIADQLGYQSEAAFSRAFKKFVGQTPGSLRRTANKVSAA